MRRWKLTRGRECRLEECLVLSIVGLAITTTNTFVTTGEEERNASRAELGE